MAALVFRRIVGNDAHIRRHSPGFPDRGHECGAVRVANLRGARARPGSTTSSPVTITATRGRRETTGSLTPTEASTARWAAPMRMPGRRSSEPIPASEPLGTMF